MEGRPYTNTRRTHPFFCRSNDANASVTDSNDAMATVALSRGRYAGSKCTSPLPVVKTIRAAAQHQTVHAGTNPRKWSWTNQAGAGRGGGTVEQVQ